MGLLSDKWNELQAYVQANTPRNTRPRVSTAKVLYEGLLNPNKYNAPAANRFKDSMFGLLGVVPGVGDAASAAESADLFNRGDKFGGSLAALGALPLVPALGGMVKQGGKAGGLLAQGDDVAKIGKMKDLPYQIDHKPMTVDGGASRLDDLTGAFGEDIYGKNALQYFGTGIPEERTTLKIMQSLRGKPDELVSIYRGVPDGVSNINPGDWVTLDRNVAMMYADPTAYGEGAKGAGKVIELKVPAKSITSWPDSLLEFGYYPE